MVGKPDRRLPRVYLLHLHALQCRLKVPPEQKRIRNRRSGEENSGQPCYRPPCSADQQNRKSAYERKQGKRLTEGKVLLILYVPAAGRKLKPRPRPPAAANSSGCVHPVTAPAIVHHPPRRYILHRSPC